MNDEKSESEPSVDNLDKNQIMKLMPNTGKRRKRRKNKFKKFDKKKDNKNRDLDIELFNPIKEAAKKLEEEKKKKLKNPKIIINCNNANDKNKKNLKQQTIMTDPNMKNEYTQTEEIFFKMHWSYFSGQYKILACRKKITYSNNHYNFIGVSANLFGQLNKNYYKRQMDINNINALNKLNANLYYNSRSKSLNNKIILNNKIEVPIANNNLKNLNINKNNISNKYNNLNNNNNNKNLSNDNDQKNNEDINDGQNNKKLISQNSAKKLNIENNKLFNLTMNKGLKKESLNKEFIKTTNSNSLSNPIGNKNSKSKNNNMNMKKGTNINNENNNNKFYSTKYNGFNKNKINNNLKIKMAKSSSSFYKQ